jgi:hypothetical protein
MYYKLFIKYLLIILFIIDLFVVIKLNHNKYKIKKDYIYEVLFSISLGIIAFVEFLNYKDCISLNTSKLIELPLVIILLAYICSNGKYDLFL